MREFSIHRFLVGCLLVAMTLFFLSGAWAFNSVRKDEARAFQKVSTVTSKLASALDPIISAEKAITPKLKVINQELTPEKTAAIAKDFWLASEGQRRYWNEDAKQVGETIKSTKIAVESVNKLIVETNNSLNSSPDGLIPKMTETTESAGVAIQVASAGVQPILDESAKAAHNIEQIAGDEDWKKVADNIASTSESMMEASGNVNGITKDVHDAVHNCSKYHGLHRIWCTIW